MTRNVYRLEHPQTQQGPFHHLLNDGSDYALWLRERLLSTSGHLPSAEIECPAFTPGVHVCGAPSIDVLTKWFGSYWNRLFEYGFRLYQYAVPNMETHEGASQIVFNPALATYRYERPAVDALKYRQL